MADADDFLPSASGEITRDGETAEASIHVRATSRAAALAHEDSPRYGEQIVGATGLLYCGRVKAETVDGAAGDTEGALLYRVTAFYGPLDKVPVEGKARWAVRSQDEIIKLKAVADAAHAVHYLGGGGSAPSVGYNGLGIAVTDKGADGCDYEDGCEVLAIDLWVNPADVPTKLAAIRALAQPKHVNDDAFAGPWGSYAAGEARLNGFQVSHVNGELDQIALEFLCRKNVEFGIDLTDGTEHTVSKKGHQYYWQRTEKRTGSADDDSQDVGILDAHLATIYDAGDFDTLGISNDMFDYSPAS